MDHPSSGKESSFEERLRQAEDKIGPSGGSGPAKGEAESSSGFALRVATELVAGPVVGLAVGYGLDRLTGCRVLFLILFALLGCAAGMRNVWRMVNVPELKSGPENDRRSQRGRQIDD